MPLPHHEPVFHLPERLRHHVTLIEEPRVDAEIRFPEPQLIQRELTALEKIHIDPKSRGLSLKPRNHGKHEREVPHVVREDPDIAFRGRGVKHRGFPERIHGVDDRFKLREELFHRGGRREPFIGPEEEGVSRGVLQHRKLMARGGERHPESLRRFRE